MAWNAESSDEELMLLYRDGEAGERAVAVGLHTVGGVGDDGERAAGDQGKPHAPPSCNKHARARKPRQAGLRGRS